MAPHRLLLAVLMVLWQPALAASSSSSSAAPASSSSSSDAISSSNASASTVTGVLNDVSGGSESISQGGALVATAMLLLGGFVALAGARFVKAIVFVEGFVLGGYAFATLVDSALVSWSYAVMASWSSFLVGGVIFGAVVLSANRVGVALVGAAAGFVLAYVLFIFLGRPLNANEPIMVLVVLCTICGLVGGLATWSSARFVLVAATSWTGAGLVVYAFGYFAGGFPNAHGLRAFWKAQTDGEAWEHAFPGGWWGYLLGFLILVTAGAAAQLRLARALDERRRGRDNGCGMGEHEPECGLELIATPPSSFGLGKRSWSGSLITPPSSYDGEKRSWSHDGSGSGTRSGSGTGSGSTPIYWSEGDRTSSEVASRARHASQTGILV